MAGNYINPVPQYSDDNGNPLAGGILYFSENEAAWSTNPQAVYLDADMTTPATYITLDSAGRVPDFYGPADLLYRVVLKKSNGTTVWTRDNRQFFDGQELVALVAELEALIADIETVVTNSNPIRNPTTEIITADDSVTLTTSFQPHVCVGIDGRVASNVTAGTMTSGTLSGLGSTNRQAKMTGVSGDSSSVVEWRFRVGSAEAVRFANETCSVSAVMRQESGLTGTATIAVYKANSADNFSAVTLVGSTTASVPSSTNTELEYAGLAMGDVSNGIELLIRIQPGGAFSTKDFYLTDIQIAVGATAPSFTAPSYPEARAEAVAVGLGVFRDSGTANAAVVTTRSAVSLYDGLTLVVFRPTGNSAAMTLNVDGNGAVDVVHSDGRATRANDTLANGYYRFRYSGPLSKWVLENPNPASYSLTASGFINITGPTVPSGSGITSASSLGAGNYRVTLSNTYASDGAGGYKMQPVITPFHNGSNIRAVKITAWTATTFDVQFEDNSANGAAPSEGFFVHVTGVLA